MHVLSDFHLGADVVAADGRKVGTVARVVVEANGFDPRALVVKEEESFAGRFLAAESMCITDEVVVPISAVESANREVVKISISSRDVRHQPPYLSHHLKTLTDGTALFEDAEVLSGVAVIPPYVETAAKSADEVEIDKGENVMLGTTGRRLGKVEDVLFDDGEMIGVVVRPDGYFKQDVMLPIRFISRADDMSLFAHLEQADIDHLKRFSDG
jgi:sporulation protein YlmC with PRC-barrel domain